MDNLHFETLKDIDLAKSAISDEFLESIAKLLISSKGEEVSFFYNLGSSYISKNVFLVSALSPRHISSLVDDVQKISKQSGLGSPVAEKSKEEGWSVIDIIKADCIVHIFLPEVREKYKIEEILSKNSPTPSI